MSRVFTLERLQSIDQEWDEKTKRARQIDERLASDPAVTARRADLEAEERLHAEGRSTLRTREMEAKSVDLEIKEIEGRLYGGRVSNPKELQDLEKDLQMHKRQRSHLDDQLLELMEAVDQTQKRVDEKSAALKKVEGTRATDVESLSRERETITARLAALTADREQLRATLDADALRTYDYLRRTKAGRAVSQIRTGACSACGVSVPTGLVQRVRAGSELVFCSGCGRILSG
ncbi:MAG: zinc ribbon domain-containing protein [Acidobacteriota bacterium]